MAILRNTNTVNDLVGLITRTAIFIKQSFITSFNSLEPVYIDLAVFVFVSNFQKARAVEIRKHWGVLGRA